MSTRLTDWESGFRNDFLTDGPHPLALRLTPSPVQMNARAMQTLDVRANIDMPQPTPYGSFFDIVG